MRSGRRQGQIQDPVGIGHPRKETQEGGARRHRQPHRSPVLGRRLEGRDLERLERHDSIGDDIVPVRIAQAC